MFTGSAVDASVYPVHSITTAGDSTMMRFQYEAVNVDGEAKIRLRRVVAPTPAIADLATCAGATPPVGCRVLELAYAETTTADEASPGDYAGRVASMVAWSAEPATATEPARMVAATVTRYAYDPAGNLRRAWDPRLTPALITGYDYDPAGRLAAVTPPGEKPWRFRYDDRGRLVTVQRASLVPGSNTVEDGVATTTVVYDVPLSGPGAPHDVSQAAMAAWGQTDVPTTATAVFPPDQVPAGPPTDWTRATVSYLDLNGREVNTATPGGHVTTTEYDARNNVVRQLSAETRELALGTSPDADARLDELGLRTVGTLERAGALSTLSTYSDDGRRLTQVVGPLHTIRLAHDVPAAGSQPALSAGEEVLARASTRHSYDQGRPTTAVIQDMLTRTDTGGRLVGRETAADVDVRTTATEYDWTLGSPTKVVTDPDGLAITRRSAYDAEGQVVKTVMPKSNGADAGTQLTDYYTAEGAGPCGGHPEWAGLTCRTRPAGTISGGGANPAELPTTVTTYTGDGQPATITETANGVTRTTTTDYDPAGRPVSTRTGGPGTAVPTVETG